MPISITGMFAPSGGAGSFNLYDPADMAAGDVDVLIRLIAGGRIYTNGIAGEIVIQTGAGVPSHSATEGTLYWNTVADVLYCNNNGTTGWTAIGSSGAGSVGPPGIPGFDGLDGLDGYSIPGATGAPGAAGGTGATGATGGLGPPGFDAEDGLDGFPGPTGAAGAVGATGAAGAAGAQGSTGSAGPPGFDGLDGIDGLDAIPGPVGPVGATGSTGSTGATGAQGSIGLSGQPGVDGLDGLDGVDGFPVPGPVGASIVGPMGPPGLDGLPSDDLLWGLPGIPTPAVPLSEITITIPSPVAGDDFTIRTFKLATTLYEVSSVIVAGTNVVFNLYHGTDRSAAGTKALTADVTETSKTTGTVTGGASWADATVDAGAHLRGKVVSVSGTVTELSLSIRYYPT